MDQYLELDIVTSPFPVRAPLARVKPQWIQGNLKGRWNQRPRKKTFNFRYIERLEKNSVVGKLVEKKRLSNLVYVEYQ